jgi:hypothetical protein
MLSNLIFTTEYLTDIIVRAFCIFLAGNFHVVVKLFGQNGFLCSETKSFDVFPPLSAWFGVCYWKQLSVKLRLTCDLDNLTNVAYVCQLNYTCNYGINLYSAQKPFAQLTEILGANGNILNGLNIILLPSKLARHKCWYLLRFLPQLTHRFGVGAAFLITSELLYLLFWVHKKKTEIRPFYCNL